MNHGELIGRNIACLVDSIDVNNTTLWDRLAELGVFKLNDVEYIKVSTGSILHCGID